MNTENMADITPSHIRSGTPEKVTIRQNTAVFVVYAVIYMEPLGVASG